MVGGGCVLLLFYRKDFRFKTARFPSPAFNSPPLCNFPSSPNPRGVILRKIMSIYNCSPACHCSYSLYLYPVPLSPDSR